MPAIRHTHRRWLDAPLGEVRPLLDALWGGQRGDAFPYEAIRPWRRPPVGATGFVLGTAFGHGPYRFVIEQCDERHVRARIETPGYAGYHGFELREARGGTEVVHHLEADVVAPQWLLWRGLVGPVHDWAVQTCLLRLERLARPGVTPALVERPAPWRLGAFKVIQKALRSKRPASPAPTHAWR